MDHFVILFQYLGEDQDDIQIYYHDIFCYKIPEDIVHHGLEDGRIVSHTEEYY